MRGGRVSAKPWSRRDFLRTCGAVTVGFVAYQRAFTRGIDALAEADAASRGFGPMVKDPAGVIDLPADFTYKIVARAGDEMADGLLVPGLPDAMATFEGPDGLTIVVCNHEALFMRDSAFGPKNTRLARIATDKFYDFGFGMTPCPGGTTTFVWDTKAQKLVRHYLSLAGTLRNCAGGSTPWGSWISCEETVLAAGEHDEEKLNLQKDHGYCFEVPVRADVKLADPVPLTAMGRFMHEAVGVDPKTGIVYLTEDRDDGLIYRFLPTTRGDLRAGGRLQALVVANGVRDVTNWPERGTSIQIGEKVPVKWMDLDDIQSPRDDLRARGYAAGACRFARAEGMWVGDDEIYWACTSGGRAQIGQIFRYRPGKNEGADNEGASPGRLELFIEPNNPKLINSPDNLTISPWGDLIVCEDTGGDDARLIGVTRDGALYTFAHSRVNGEYAGATFSPDGSTLFVNAQEANVTLAITGPWRPM